MHLIIDATTTQDQLAYAGIGQYTKNIVCTLIENYPNIEFSVLLFADRATTLCDVIYKHKNVKIVNIGKYQINDFKNDIWYYTKVLPKIKEIKKENSIYFSPYFWRNYPSSTLPTVLFVHDMNLAMFNMYSQKSFLHNQIRKVQYWMTMNKSMKCKHIIFNSETTKKDYLKYYPKYPEQNTTVSYLGVDLEEKEVSLENVLPKDYKQKGYLIYMGGGINKTKNSKGVIQAYVEFLKLLSKEKTQSPYLVISGGIFEKEELKEVQELHELVKENNIEDLVLFTGFYEDQQKYSLLKNAFAFIHLSMYEGFGFSPIEALRSKVPTILHKNPVYEELFNEVAVMVDGTKPEEVASSIYDVYSNFEKYQSRVEKGSLLSKEYTWENVAKKTYEVFEEVFQKTNGRGLSRKI
jgi:glycosyltransferase involved in cell wall biosynthesis